MKNLVLIILFLSTTGMMHSQRGMHPHAQIEYVKSQLAEETEPYYSAYLKLLSHADAALIVSHHAIADFAVPGFYQKPAEHRANKQGLQEDAFNAYSLALAYRLSGDKRYGKKACTLLNAWATVNKKYSEPDGSLVMVYLGSGLLMAAELMSSEKVWKKEDEKVFRQWVVNVYQDATNSIRIRKNNWADWGRFGSLLAASYMNDEKEIGENIRLIKSDLFDKIAADGSMPEEVKRGEKGIWYTYFSLAPMTASCWLAYTLTGENLFTLEQNGASVKKSLDYLFYYNAHPEEWKWYDHPETGKDEIWPYNLFEAMSLLYKDEKYEAFAKNKRPIMYGVHHFAWVFPTLMPVDFKYKPSKLNICE